MSAYCQECFFNVDEADPVEFGAENFDTCPDCGGTLISDDQIGDPDFSEEL